jgi:DNA polymerase, archaea type
VLGLLCRELARRGATLLEGDTDGVYFAVPAGWDEARERAVVAEVAALLPPLVRLEFEGRYAAMLSHEPKNYALLEYGDKLILRGVAFRSSRAEPYGEAFLRRAIARLLVGDVPGVQAAYLETVEALRRRAVPTREVTALVRLTKQPQEYLATRATRREASYEAMLTSGRDRWDRGERVRIYRATGGRSLVYDESDVDAAANGTANDPRDYDSGHYIRLLGNTFAARLARAFTAEDFATLFDSPEQPSLFAPALDTIRPILTPVAAPPTA